MSGLEEKICRLCLTMVTHEFNIIDEVTREMFDVLLLKLNFEVSENPIICQECVEIAVEYLNFKSVCVDTEEIINAYGASKKKCKFKISDMYEVNFDVKCELGEEFSVCRFCMNPLNMSQSVVLDSLMKKTTFKKRLLEYMPEMDFNTVKNPMVCTTCLDNLQRYFEFVHNCLELEKKINAYFQENRTNADGYVKLIDVLCFTIKGKVEYSTNSPLTFTIERESNTNIFEGVESKPFDVNAKQVQVEELDIKDDGISFTVDIHHRLPEIGLDQYDDRYSSRKTCKETKLNIMPLKAQKNTARTKKCSQIEMDKRTIRTFESKQKKCVMRVKLTNNVTSKVEKCASGTFKSRQPLSLKNRIKIRNVIPIGKQKAKVCSAMTKNDGAEMKIYKCMSCTFQTHLKSSLINHTSVHKDISETEMYNCSECLYMSNDKANFNRHLIVHKDVSESEMYPCTECTFMTKHKSALEGHIIVHKDISKTETYNCSECSFKSKHKTSLIRHMLIHKDISESEMYSCSECSYKSKHKQTLNRHTSVHKDISETESYSCSECSFKCKRKFSLKRHLYYCIKIFQK